MAQPVHFMPDILVLTNGRIRVEGYIRAESAQLPEKWTKLSFQRSTKSTIPFVKPGQNKKILRLFWHNRALENTGQGTWFAPRQNGSIDKSVS